MGASTAQGLANVAWAYAALGVEHSPLMTAIADRALEPGMLAAFSPQGLANLVWAFAMLRLQHPELPTTALLANAP